MKLYRSKFQDIAFYLVPEQPDEIFPLVQRYFGYMYTNQLNGKLVSRRYIVNNLIKGFSYNIFNDKTFKYYNI